MSEHTAGPWAYQRPTKGSPYAYVVDAEERPICELNDNRTNYEANARLIACTPELLALAQKVAAFWNDPLAFGDEATVTRLAGQFAPVADSARAAVAKVEGREP